MSEGRRLFRNITVKELARRVWREAAEDRCFARAAEFSYYFLFALFPLFIISVTLIGGMPDAQQGIIKWLGGILPDELRKVVEASIRNASDMDLSLLLTSGLIGALWAASSSMVGMMDALNTAYELEETRPLWRLGLVGLALSIALSLAVIAGAVLGTFAGRLFVMPGGRGGSLTEIVIDYLVGFTVMVLGMSLMYYLAPNTRLRWKWIIPGAVFATVSFFVFSTLFSLYLHLVPSYTETYGVIGSAILLMFWLYLLGLATVIGAEINSEIQKAAQPVSGGG